MKSGDFVRQKEIIFYDGVIDEKKGRPCLVLFEFTNKRGTFVCTCPVTSQIATFNKFSGNYFLIPTIFYDPKKLSFVKIDCANIYPLNEAKIINRTLDDAILKRILDKVKVIANKKDINNKKTIIDMLEYIALFDEIDMNEAKKLEKNKKLKCKENY